MPFFRTRGHTCVREWARNSYGGHVTKVRSTTEILAVHHLVHQNSTKTYTPTTPLLILLLLLLLRHVVSNPKIAPYGFCPIHLAQGGTTNIASLGAKMVVILVFALASYFSRTSFLCLLRSVAG